VVKLPGIYEEREHVLKKYIRKYKFDVCVTTYEGYLIY
jgi:hypothetical protein